MDAASLLVQGLRKFVDDSPPRLRMSRPPWPLESIVSPHHNHTPAPQPPRKVLFTLEDVKSILQQLHREDLIRHLSDPVVLDDDLFDRLSDFYEVHGHAHFHEAVKRVIPRRQSAYVLQILGLIHASGDVYARQLKRLEVNRWNDRRSADQGALPCEVAGISTDRQTRW
jgi:hypothetical protein